MQSTTTVILRDPTVLRAAMTDKSKSTRKLAVEVGCSPARIAQLAAGEFPAAKVEIAVAIATALDRKVADLFAFPDGEALISLGLIRQVG